VFSHGIIIHLQLLKLVYIYNAYELSVLKMILFRLITYNNSRDNNILMLTKYKMPQRLIPRPPSDHLYAKRNEISSTIVAFMIEQENDAINGRRAKLAMANRVWEFGFYSEAFWLRSNTITIGANVDGGPPEREKG
jgi:hypothetical protein